MLKRVKYTTIGILVGSLLSVNTGILAESYQYVRTVLDDNISFMINGEEKSVPDGYHVLIYEDRTYVPARFIAEELGADVDWDAKKRQVIIYNTPSMKNENDETVNVEEPKEEMEEQIEDVHNYEDYQSLPITKNINQVLVTVKEINIDNEQTTVNVEVNNLGKPPYQLNQFKTKIITEDIEYGEADLDDKIIYRFDYSWFNDIREDEKNEGILRLPPIPKDTGYVILHITLVQNDGTQKESTLEFKIKLD